MFNFDVNALVESLKPAVGKMAESLGTSADKLIEIGARGQFAEGIGLAIATVFMFAVTVVSAVAMRSGFKRMSEDKINRWEKDGEMTALVASVICACSVLGVIFLAYFAAIHIIAPEYALMLEVKDILTQK